jgi:hypothetical protein
MPGTVFNEVTCGTRLRQGFVGQTVYALVRRDAHAEAENQWLTSYQILSGFYF